jgi:hypothetical protein
MVEQLLTPEQSSPPEPKADERKTVRKTAVRRKPLPRVRKNPGVKELFDGGG